MYFIVRQVVEMTGEGYRKHSVGAILSWDGISAVSAATLSALDVQLGTCFEIAELAPHCRTEKLPKQLKGWAKKWVLGHENLLPFVARLALHVAV